MLVTCRTCSTSFNKKSNQIRKTKNNFCSLSCAATYNNKIYPKKKSRPLELCTVCLKNFAKSNQHKRCKTCSSQNILIENIILFSKTSKFSNQTLRHRILEQKLLPYICFICNLTSTWNNKILTLQLDHVNGNRNDCRLDNLRFLCPNCHSQTSTWCGRKTGSGARN